MPPLERSVGPTVNIISLGAGVQSTTMLLMAMHGEIEPMPDCAIFADTGWEPQAVYDHLAWLESISTIPIRRVSAGNLRDDTLAAINDPKAFVTLPLYAMDTSETKRMLRRQCTRQYKLSPLQREVKRIAGRGPTSLWIGISLDEVQRMKESRVKYIEHRWPLIEQRLTRADCLRWMSAHNYPTPPRSACLGCPFKSDAEWRDLRRSPDEWAATVAVDEAVRSIDRVSGVNYLHRRFEPLAVVDLATEQEKGQLDMWGNECEGMCGL